MARLIYGLSQSLDGYVDHQRMQPDLALFRHFLGHVRELGGCLYGRRVYQIMQYWDHEQPGWESHEFDFAAAWRSKPKWVVSRTLDTVGPNASLVKGDLETAVRELKDSHEGEIDVAGPDLAGSLAALGLIDEYRLYLRPFVLGQGTPYFAGACPPLRLVADERIGGDAIRLTYVPA